jgi:hypothetical protein
VRDEMAQPIGTVDRPIHQVVISHC